MALTGGGDLLDGPDGLDPLFGTEGREVKLSDPEPPPGALPAQSDLVREKAALPAQPLPTGPTDPALLEEALAELERMVGLEPVKRQVKALSAQLNMARLRAEQGLPVQPPKRHFVFSGPSGTGKTTVARILGRVFYALGLLGGDHLVEAQRADLVGEYLGQTAVKANELIDSAIGGVLFVDEAYSLSNSGYGKGDAYGDEALQVLLKRAEDNRDHLVVILAGYPEGMDGCWQPTPVCPRASRPGSTSRRTAPRSSPRSARSWLRRTATVGTRRPWRSSARSPAMSWTRAGSTSSATGGFCGRCTRRAAPTEICGSRGTRGHRPGTICRRCASRT